jgi:hypothetical protein
LTYKLNRKNILAHYTAKSLFFFFIFRRYALAVVQLAEELSPASLLSSAESAKHSPPGNKKSAAPATNLAAPVRVYSRYIDVDVHVHPKAAATADRTIAGRRL